MTDSVGIVVGLQRSAGGVPKTAVAEAAVRFTGMEGDAQRDRRHHGGPLRALCLYSQECIEALRAEGHPIVAGAVGENVTISGLDWVGVVPGARLVIGDVEVEVASYTTPCRIISAAFADRWFMRISQDFNPGWSRVYVRVVREGRIELGSSVVLTSP